MRRYYLCAPTTVRPNRAFPAAKLKITAVQTDIEFLFASDDSREAIAERERNAAHPYLLKAATFCLVLSGAFLVVSFMFSFVMFMNARESVLRESTGSYHTSTFRVLQSYWQQGSDLSSSRPGVQRRAFARGLVEGNQEWMDLGPYLVVVPKDADTMQHAVPPGTLIPVFYNPRATGYYRVLLLGNVPPVDANKRVQAASAKYGLLCASVFGLMLFLFLRLRGMCF
jgi:hypothetical protein